MDGKVSNRKCMISFQTVQYQDLNETFIITFGNFFSNYNLDQEQYENKSHYEMLELIF